MCTHIQWWLGIGTLLSKNGRRANWRTILTYVNCMYANCDLREQIYREWQGGILECKTTVNVRAKLSTPLDSKTHHFFVEWRREYLTNGLNSVHGQHGKQKEVDLPLTECLERLFFFLIRRRLVQQISHCATVVSGIKPHDNFCFHCDRRRLPNNVLQVYTVCLPSVLWFQPLFLRIHLVYNASS